MPERYSGLTLRRLKDEVPRQQLFSAAEDSEISLPGEKPLRRGNVFYFGPINDYLFNLFKLDNFKNMSNRFIINIYMYFTRLVKYVYNCIFGEFLSVRLYDSLMTIKPTRRYPISATDTRELIYE